MEGARNFFRALLFDLTRHCEEEERRSNLLPYLIAAV